MQLTWLGINGFILHEDSRTLLIDPYVTRDPQRLCNPELVRRHVPPADDIIITHSHWDHLADIAEVARLSGSLIHGSQTTLNICRYHGIAETRLRPLLPGSDVKTGPFRITVLPSLHMHPMLYPGEYSCVPPSVTGASDYLEGGSVALRVECGGISFLDIGSANCIDDAIRGQDVDILFVSIAQKAEDFLPRLLGLVRAKTVIPIHWDDYCSGSPERPGERASIAQFSAEMRRIAPEQQVRIMRPLETIELPENAHS